MIISEEIPSQTTFLLGLFVITTSNNEDIKNIYDLFVDPVYFFMWIKSFVLKAISIMKPLILCRNLICYILVRETKNIKHITGETPWIFVSISLAFFELIIKTVKLWTRIPQLQPKSFFPFLCIYFFTKETKVGSKQNKCSTTL